MVVLPAPLGPRKPVTRPGRTVKLRSTTARMAPKFLLSPATSMEGVVLGAPRDVVINPWCAYRGRVTPKSASTAQAALCPAAPITDPAG